MKHLKYNFLLSKSEFIDMGCKKEVLVEDLKKCIDYYEQNFLKK